MVRIYGMNDERKGEMNAKDIHAGMFSSFKLDQIM
jgi:hypothetical protein